MREATPHGDNGPETTLSPSLSDEMTTARLRASSRREGWHVVAPQIARLMAISVRARCPLLGVGAATCSTRTRLSAGAAPLRRRAMDLDVAQMAVTETTTARWLACCRGSSAD
jgi:hypothetical protein